MIYHFVRLGLFCFVQRVLCGAVESVAVSQVQGPWFELGLLAVVFLSILQFPPTSQKHTSW